MGYKINSKRIHLEFYSIVSFRFSECEEELEFSSLLHFSHSVTNERYTLMNNNAWSLFLLLTSEDISCGKNIGRFRFKNLSLHASFLF